MWNLQSAIVIPNSVKHIGAYAFYGISMYSKLMYQDAAPSIYLGDSVITIGEHAFDRLDWLTSITILSIYPVILNYLSALKFAYMQFL